MPLSQKHKVVFWSLLLVLVLVMFSAFIAPYMRNMRIRSIVRTYNRWTSPSIGRGGLLKLLIASKYGTSKLKGIVAKDCNMTIEYPNGYVEHGSSYAAIDSLTGIWFVENVDRIILSGPVIEPNGDGYTAKMTELMYEKSEMALWEIELFIKKYDSKYLISMMKLTRNNPTDEELNKLQNMIKVKWYRSYKGFGGRYNEPYTFSEPSFSPDGRKLVFSSLSPGSDIYIANLDGSGLKRLTNTKYWEVLPQFSPDGKNIIFMSDKENYGGEYYIIDLDGSNYRRLVTDYFGVSEACFSPDGKCIAFVAHKGLSCEVYLMNADGTNIKQLTNTGNKCSSIKFSNDSKKLFFVQQWYDYERAPALTEEIFSINIDGSDFKQLTNARDENARIKKILDLTNNHVFFLRKTYQYDNIPIDQRPNDNEVWKMSYDGSMMKKLLGGKLTHGVYDDVKAVSDGKAIVFVDDSEKPYSYTLNIKEIEDSEKTLKLSKERICNSKLAVSPNGKYVAYILLPQIPSRNDEARGLSVVSVDGKESWTIGDNLNRE